MLSTPTNTSTFVGFKNTVRSEEDFALAREHIAHILKDQFKLNLRNARLSNVVAKICGFSCVQALASQFEVKCQFPFDEIRDTGNADGDYFYTLEEALIMVEKLGLPGTENHVWSVCEGDNGFTYGPSHHYIDRLGYIVTREQHDGDTYYYDDVSSNMETVENNNMPKQAYILRLHEEDLRIFESDEDRREFCYVLAIESMKKILQNAPRDKLTKTVFLSSHPDEKPLRVIDFYENLVAGKYNHNYDGWYAFIREFSSLVRVLDPWDLIEFPLISEYTSYLCPKKASDLLQNNGRKDPTKSNEFKKAYVFRIHDRDLKIFDNYEAYREYLYDWAVENLQKIMERTPYEEKIEKYKSNIPNEGTLTMIDFYENLVARKYHHDLEGFSEFCEYADSQRDIVWRDLNEFPLISDLSTADHQWDEWIGRN